MPYIYPKRNRDYADDVIVTKDETHPLPRRYCAHLSHAERIEEGRLREVPVDVPDAYGPTVTEAMRALDAAFDVWRRALPSQS